MCTTTSVYWVDKSPCGSDLFSTFCFSHTDICHVNIINNKN